MEASLQMVGLERYWQSSSNGRKGLRASPIVTGWGCPDCCPGACSEALSGFRVLSGIAELDRLAMSIKSSGWAGGGMCATSL